MFLNLSVCTSVHPCKARLGPSESEKEKGMICAKIKKSRRGYVELLLHHCCVKKLQSGTLQREESTAGTHGAKWRGE
jgi:hypothetical protein